MRKKKFILLIIIILLCIPAYLWIKRQLEIDACLDKGGRWNYESGKCECQAQKDSLRSDIPEGWRMPTGYEHADGWRKENPERFLKVIGDFNGDSEVDEARLLLRKKDKALGLFIKNRWSKHNEFFLLEVGDSSLIHSVGIRLVKPGLYVTACGKGYWKCGENESPEIQLKYDAVDLFKIESANSFFYWDSLMNDFERIWMSD